MRPIWRVAIAYVAFFTAMGAAWPYLPVYYRELGLDFGAIGILTAASATTQLLAAPLWGALSDRHPQNRLSLPLAALIGTCGAILLANAGDLATITLAALVLSGGLAGVGPVLDARAIETLGEARHRYGQIRALGSGAFVVASWAVGILLDQHGTRALFLVYVPALLVTALAGVTLVRRPTTRPISIRRGTAAFVRSSGMWLFLGGAFLVWTSLVAANAFYSLRVDALGGEAQMVGLAWAVGAAIEVPAMWFFPRLAKRFGTSRLLVVGATLFSVRAVAAALAMDPVTLVVIAPIEGLAYALFYVGGVTYVAARAPIGLSATAQGVFQAVSGLATVVGSALGGGIAAQLTIPGLFWVCAGASAVAAMVIALGVRAARRPPAGHHTAAAPAAAPPAAADEAR